MEIYGRIRDRLRDGTHGPVQLTAGSALTGTLPPLTTKSAVYQVPVRTAASRNTGAGAIQPVLLYIYAEPRLWPDGRCTSSAVMDAHRREIADFAEIVRRDEVAFAAITYRDMLRRWSASALADVRAHADRVCNHFLL